MNLKQLRYFLAVAEEGQMTAAAKRLHVAQPPLSYQIKQLELELGVPLFKRLPQGVVVTSAGKLLVGYAQQLTQLSATAENKIRALAHGITGTLNLGTVSSSAGVMPNQALLKWLHAHGDVQLELTEGNTYELLDDLHKRLLDVAIMRTPFNRQHLICRFFPAERMVAVLPQRFHQFENRRQLRLSDLDGLPLIKYRRFNELFHVAFLEQPFDPQFVMTCDDARTAMHWADHQIGVALVPRSLAATYDSGQVLIRSIADRRFETQLVLATTPESYATPLVAGFMDQFPQAQPVD
ncbi:LysR family transcriptional regulator [Lactiplantibacillus fabifermentans]|uniref:Transcription regulator n=2 Tax=Lactiplantibacillus fabifermentans TaxID=483011 RepID=A0A0R2NNI0_9LACO|nr:LysR family transcriptional regulator [Lactiplantibacillus fabifermentans]ETY74703.1 LysR family transcriptional regulator [Lactiplantibacillus fabifermentans T30PCM01]KRO26924.1 transcription regulator [Lactiplantibacillus fabifermentans DSM 21115]